MEIISSWWTYEVRLLPVLLALSIYSGIQLLRKLTKIEYTPSYFAIFPLSMLEGQLAAYFGENKYGEYISIKGGRKKNTVLVAKALVSMFLTFGVVPLLTGFLVAFILTAQEFTGFVFLLVGAEAEVITRRLLPSFRRRYSLEFFDSSGFGKIENIRVHLETAIIG